MLPSKPALETNFIECCQQKNSTRSAHSLDFLIIIAIVVVVVVFNIVVVVIIIITNTILLRRLVWP